MIVTTIELWNSIFEMNHRKIVQEKPTCNFLGSEGSLIQPNYLAYANHGVNASVWHYGNEDKEYAFKLFFDDCKFYALTYELYQRMKGLSLNTTIQALEVYRKSDSKEVEQYLFDAYTMKWLDEDKTRTLLETPVSLLLKNICYLQQDAQLLANESIYMKDVKKENSIFHQKDQLLYITDIDMFSCSEVMRSQDILMHNYAMLLYLIKSHLYEDIRNTSFFLPSEKGKAISMIMSDFSFSSIDFFTPVEVIEKKFSQAETPMQYYKQRVR